MAEKILNENITKQVKDAFDKQLSQPLRVMYFGKQTDCDFCADTLQLVDEVAALSDRNDLEVLDIEKDSAIARQFHVERAPGLVIAGKDGDQILDYGIRFAGIPSGYEFSSLIQGLVLVSNRDSALQPKTRQALKELKEPVNMLVFTTPT
jgi:alkyl hydroperoxide reductase subunit AhpF